MNEIIKNIEAEQLKKEVPQFNVGDTVRVHALIKEGNRERIQIFEGTVLKKQGGSTRETFTVRKASNGVGVANVNDRIQLNFGREYGLKIDSQPGEGTRCTLTLPELYADSLS